ncbi:hypothetical protein JOB18_043378 [Solea senegalensis]|uniref:Uncharacterized protein n=1 Tax=Solea senegalensis TaxID=28829 RepID=A0AAV6RGQ6_SOLSE|nr:hypothetical protein JOB18_043378 [Solea senegalensis]
METDFVHNCLSHNKRPHPSPQLLLSVHINHPETTRYQCPVKLQNKTVCLQREWNKDGLDIDRGGLTSCEPIWNSPMILTLCL